jgi:hypothetical protein
MPSDVIAAVAVLLTSLKFLDKCRARAVMHVDHPNMPPSIMRPKMTFDRYFRQASKRLIISFYGKLPLLFFFWTKVGSDHGPDGFHEYWSVGEGGCCYTGLCSLHRQAGGNDAISALRFFAIICIVTKMDREKKSSSSTCVVSCFVAIKASFLLMRDATCSSNCPMK